ncbi:MAG TPA: hypothetical protein VIN75_09250 [Burkholderiaceae bacterium]
MTHAGAAARALASRVRALVGACALAGTCLGASAADLKLATEPSAGVAPVAAASSPLTAPPEHRRPPDQTFLTFPEWFLVHSPAEYAHYLAGGERVSAFPLFAHIGQFWQAYGAVSHEVSRFPFNGGYHLMICVIGTSTTVEYSLKGVYEHTIGRLAEATVTGHEQVPEERFAAAYAQRYVDFIRVDPWYLFDFGAELRTLWSDVPAHGPNLVRRWERRFLLTTELLAKSGYGQLIKLATHSIYEAPKPVTAVVLTSPPPHDPATHPDLVVLQSTGRETLATIPRYEGFTTYSRWLADNHVDFREIAGNDSEILVSLLVPIHWRPAPRARVLFEQPILTVPDRKRSVLALPITQLGALLRDVDRQPALRVEHVYDF